MEISKIIQKILQYIYLFLLGILTQGIRYPFKLIIDVLIITIATYLAL